MATSDFILVIVLAVIVYLIAKQVAKSPRNSSNQSRRTRSTRRRPRDRQQSNNHYFKTAEKLVREGRFDEASTLYIQSGQTYLAAKAKLLKGPTYANQALLILQNRLGSNITKAVDNLIQELYYKNNRPDLAAALLRANGQIEAAEAIEVVSNIQPVEFEALPPSQVVTEGKISTSDSNHPIRPTSNNTNGSGLPVEVSTIDKEEVIIPQVTSKAMGSDLDSTELIQNQPASNLQTESIPNTLLLASSKLNDNCSVCRKSIETGDTFLYCINCRAPAHSRHLLEYVKVRGVCPICNKRLAVSMYELEE